MNSGGQGQQHLEKSICNTKTLEPLQEETFFPNDCRDHSWQKLHQRVTDMDEPK